MRRRRAMAEISSTPEAPALMAHHRISLVWLVPLVAALAAAWLGWRAVSERGPIIAISFGNAEGLEPGKTRIKHNDVDLGLVESLEPTPDLSHVIVTARVSKLVESRLTKGTRFWIVRPRLPAEGI